eukprot:Amastigsp_a340502_211.p5 type:complete len:125 gc:universal Amastigsp_a340502_211:922-548(-)
MEMSRGLSRRCASQWVAWPCRVTAIAAPCSFKLHHPAALNYDRARNMLPGSSALFCVAALQRNSLGSPASFRLPSQQCRGALNTDTALLSYDRRLRSCDPTRTRARRARPSLQCFAWPHATRRL